MWLDSLENERSKLLRLNENKNLATGNTGSLSGQEFYTFSESSRMHSVCHKDLQTPALDYKPSRGLHELMVDHTPFV